MPLNVYCFVVRHRWLAGCRFLTTRAFHTRVTDASISINQSINARASSRNPKRRPRFRENEQTNDPTHTHIDDLLPKDGYTLDPTCPFAHPSLIYDDSRDDARRGILRDVRDILISTCSFPVASSSPVHRRRPQIIRVVHTDRPRLETSRVSTSSI